MLAKLELESQDNVLTLYHHGYVSIDPKGPHFGFQFTEETAWEFIKMLDEVMELNVWGEELS